MVCRWLVLLYGLFWIVSPAWAEEGNFSILDPDISMDDTFRNQPESRPRRVAVLPFTNETDSPGGPDFVRRAFFNHFSSLSYEILKLVQSDERLHQAYMGDEKALASAPLDKLASVLKVDAIIRGKVTSFSQMFAVVASKVSVGAELELVGIPEGRVLWRGKQTAVSVNGGLPTSPIDLLFTIIASAANMRETVLYRVTDQWARDLVGTIPDTPAKNVTKPPSIRTVVHNAANLSLKAGAWLEVAMEGDAGRFASFDIGTFKKGLPMEEVQPGIYRGRYQVAPKDNADGETLVAHLGDASGQVSQWMDFQGPITLDTIPPKAPTGVTGRGTEGKAVLRWTALPDKDLVAYLVLRSESPLSGYREVARVEDTACTDSGLRNGTTYYYKVEGVDRAGNVGAASPPLAVVPMKAGPTPVTGDLEQDTHWRKGGSPYVIEKSIIVPRGVRLEAEPGVEVVLSGGAGITIKGILLLEGSTEEPVLLRKADGQSKEWQGILLDQTLKENRLRHVSVRDAELGVVVYNSRILMEEVKLTRNGTGATFIESSESILRKSEVSHNRGTGVTVVQSNPVIQGNLIGHNEGFGLVVRHGLPKVQGNLFHGNRAFDLVGINEGKIPLDLSENGWGTCNPFHVWDRIAAWHVNRSCITTMGGKPLPLAVVLPAVSAAAQTPDSGAGIQSAVRKFQDGDHPGAYLELMRIPDEERTAPAHYLLGRLWSAAGKMKESLEGFQKAADLDPGQLGYRYWLGIHHVRMGHPDKAERVWREAAGKGEYEPIQSMLKVLH